MFVRNRVRSLHRAVTSSLTSSAMIDSLESRQMMDATYFNLASGNFSQDWSNTGQITTNNVWSGVPSIVGYTGIGTTSGVDPRTLTNATATTVQVFANSTATTSTTGGIYEYELANPTIGIIGSNNANAGSPYIQLHLDTTGVNSVDIKYNVRDLTANATDASQHVALQYRTTNSGPWTNVDAAYVADATTGGSATQVTPVAVTLPADAANQATLQLRIIDGNASGSDEAVGIDDIVVQPTPVVSPPGNFQLDPAGVRISEDGGVAIVTVTRQGGTGGAVAVDYATSDITATAGADYTATSGTLQFADGQTSADIQIPLTNDSDDELAEQFGVTISNPTGGAGLNPTTSNVVSLVDADGQKLSDGPLTQDWSNTDLIGANDNWNSVYNITGYLSDADRDAGVVDVIANQANPAGQSQGGVGEFDGIGDPTVALQGSNAAATPQLVFDLDTRGVASVDVEFDALDIDSSADNAIQPISVGYRIGNAGDFTEIYNLEDATTGPSLADMVTHVLASLPGDAIGQELVQVRVATFNAAGNDEWVGVDNIHIGASGVVTAPPALTSSDFSFETSQSVQLVFDKDVSASLDNSDIQLQNLTTGQFVPSSNIQVSSTTDGGITTAKVTFSSLLADGNYSLHVVAGGVSTAAGPANTDDLVATPFYVLGGDADRSRSVNFNDLVAVAQNYNGTGKTFSQGDFNYDTKVDFQDLVILAQHYNTNLAALTAATVKAGSVVAGQTGVGASLFSTAPIGLSDMLSMVTKQSAVDSVAPIARAAKASR